MLGNIHSIETFGSADGPGVRYLIFLKGCNMRCKYCHNPDTWAKTEGEMKSAEEILQQALRYKRYWGKKGGITVSGGEALLQIDFVTELFTLAKEKGVNTCLDTAGNPFTREKPFYSKFEKLMEDENREKIAKSLKEYGFTYVTLDLMGYRTGSMNETL